MDLFLLAFIKIKGNGGNISVFKWIKKYKKKKNIKCMVFKLNLCEFNYGRLIGFNRNFSKLTSYHHVSFTYGNLCLSPNFRIFCQAYQTSPLFREFEKV